MRIWRSIPAAVAAALLASCGVSAVRDTAVTQGAPVTLAEQPVERADAPAAVERPAAEGVAEARAGTEAGLPQDPPANCPLTRPQQPLFEPPPPYAPQFPYRGSVWYGSDQLWTSVPADGIWRMAQDGGRYFDKSFWWREGYNWTEEPAPKLSIAARNLDDPAQTVSESQATNGFHEDLQGFMLTGIDLPAAGCWEITGTYDQHSLSFVVWVVP